LKFKEYTEKNGLNKIFYSAKGGIKEEIPQRIFQVLAQLFIEDKGLSISPETNIGRGEVDFKFSKGSENVLIELKVSSNPKWFVGLRKQLIEYYQAEKPIAAYYVMIHTGDFIAKNRKLKRETKVLSKHYKIEYFDIDADIKPPASKL
jgi:hypothetical protein